MILWSLVNNDLKESRNKLQQTIGSLFIFFDNHQLTINADTLKVKNQIIKTSATVKRLGNSLTKNLKFQDEVKKIRREAVNGSRHFVRYVIFFQLRHDYYYLMPYV